MYFRLRSGEPFAFAGLWDTWNSPAGQTVHSCSIITTVPNDLVKPIHDRMPVILPPETEADWLTPDAVEAADLAGLLAPYPAGLMDCRQVSPLVNNVRNDSPACTAPDGAGPAAGRLL
jgi:putative SOS response-associated peptidase YedK